MDASSSSSLPRGRREPMPHGRNRQAPPPCAESLAGVSSSPSPHRRPPLLLFLFFRDESSSGSLVPSVDRLLCIEPGRPNDRAPPARPSAASMSPSPWAAGSTSLSGNGPKPMGEAAPVRPYFFMLGQPARFGPFMFFSRSTNFIFIPETTVLQKAP